MPAWWLACVPLLAALVPRLPLADGGSPSSAAPLVAARSPTEEQGQPNIISEELAAANQTKASRQNALAMRMTAWTINTAWRAYICRAGSVATRCPDVASELGKHVLDLAVPPDAAWLFLGPSYMTEIFVTLVAANGGCTQTGKGREWEAEKKHTAAHPAWRLAKRPAHGPVATGERSLTCQLSNGAILTFTDDARDNNKATFAGSAWTHGVFMQPHNSAEYEAEHERAGREGRPADPSKFLDSEGRDMCLRRDGEMQPAEPSDFPSYDACMARRSELRAFDAMLGGANERLLVAPWHVVPPPESIPGTYFSRGRAKTIGCFAELQYSGELTPAGFKQYGISEGALHDLRAHQCVTVCAFHGEFPSSCDPGSVSWIAHDIVARLRGP